MRIIVFYDNQCSVCNYWVNWILENDSQKKFCFAALDSDFANEFSLYFNYDFPAETIVLWDEVAGFMTKSAAVVFILQTIEGFSIQAKTLKLFPKFLRDWGYSIFAYFRRYIKMSKCKIPSMEEKKRFLTSQSFQVFLNQYKD